MAAFSCLKNIGKLNTLGSVLASFKNASKTKVFHYVPVRTSHGHERTMPIKTSLYPLMKTKDLIIFYIMLGAIPLIALATYVNIFIGPAELALIPEGYEPKHWEYYKHPITRFLAKNVLPSPQERYERTIHNIFIAQEISQIKKLKLKVKEKMRERFDYQAWYYDSTMHPKYGRKLREDVEKQKDGSKAVSEVLME